jgi:hypothetical protein
MDDYNLNVLSDAKNEYSSRLLNILSPLVVEGVKSIFSEAVTLCVDNDEDDKYLMTFQNFLSRVPNWNNTIIDEETKRIVEHSKCNYLEDLLTCVHITQVKILTSIRVSNNQKKIEIDIPKLATFIHNVYINYARKLYSNVYLFEKNIMPLEYQKNMRESKILCRESILEVIRNSMPIEHILRAYMDETTYDEVLEETLEKQVNGEEAEDMLEEAKKNLEKKSNTNEVDVIKTQEKTIDETEIEVKNPELVKNKEEPNKENVTMEVKEKTNNEPNMLEQETNEPNIDKIAIQEIKDAIKDEFKKNSSDNLDGNTTKAKISFNDTDSVLDMGTNISNNVLAPKNIERLEEISRVNKEKERNEYDGDDDDFEDDGPLNILDDPISLNDIEDLTKPKLKLDEIILDDIEVLG